ncbi:mechanosensitive ion channel domain-containing protein [candidate division KSB1 bacterium]
MDSNQLTSSIIKGFSDFAQRFVNYIPNLLMALFLLIIGLIAAYIIRFLTGRIASRISKIIPHRKFKQIERGSRFEWLTSNLVSRVVFWIVFLIFAAAATEALKLQVVTAVLNRLINYLPEVFSAVLIFLAGILISRFARNGIVNNAALAGIGYAELLGNLVRFAILLISSVIALDQIGVDSTLLILVTAIVVGAMLGGTALAFGLGARTAVSNIISAYYLSQYYKLGNHVKIGDISGIIIEFKTTSVVLDTSEGILLVPAKEFSENASVLMEVD